MMMGIQFWNRLKGMILKKRKTQETGGPTLYNKILEGGDSIVWKDRTGINGSIQSPVNRKYLRKLDLAYPWIHIHRL